MKLQNLLSILFTPLLLIISSCSDEWLEVKPDRQLIVPETLEDMRLLLSDEGLFTNDYISLMQMSSDEYALSDDRYNALSTIFERTAYLWASDLYLDEVDHNDWNKPYNQIITANIALEGLNALERTPSNENEIDELIGTALFLRSKSFYYLAQTFAPQYDPSTSDSDLGIPLRLTSDPNISFKRSTLEETYTQIIEDFEEAASLLPSGIKHAATPSKASAYGFLARAHLSMRNYESALDYADLTLSEHNTLIDYNTLIPAGLFPFPAFNEETIYYGQVQQLYSIFVFLLPNFVNPDLYNSYDDNDLRKALYFHSLGSGNYAFKGTYQGGIIPFSGIASDEMYLIRGECRARSGDIAGAMSDVNTLLEQRFTTGTYTPYSAVSTDEAVDILLNERKKELIGRGLRWSDLKRLNKEPSHAITLSRTVNGTDYSLDPNDPKYVFPIPPSVITLSGIKQNER